jgi:glutamine synthetase
MSTPEHGRRTTKEESVSDLDQFVEAPGRAEQVADVRRRIDAEGITYIYYQFVSVTGRIMGKGVPAKHWETIAQKGFQLDGEPLRRPPR